ncbi:MAG TPA: S8 family serine peptidase [Bacteroidia bacterium]|nr:S8 family serine peptidase [Bacteroidia bacterium]
MNKLFTLAFVLLLQLSNAQNVTYWVTLKDKKESTFSLEQPQAFLSAKALERRERQHIPLVQNDIPVSPVYIQEIRKTGVHILHCSKWFNIVSISTDDAAKIDAIKALPFVKAVQLVDHPSAKRRVSKFGTIQPLAKPLKEEETHGVFAYNYGYAFKQAEQLGVVCMHSKGFNGEGMTIAVLDAGFYNVNILAAFDSLRLENRLLGTRDFVTGDTMVYEDYYHGMMVLSCMAGNIPGKIVGAAPKAKYWLLRTETTDSESLQEEMNWAVGAEFADSVGADIISTSLGYSTFDDTLTNHTYKDMDGNTTIITRAADFAASKGIFVSVSAGNEGDNSDWVKITAPADGDSVLAVGAIDSVGNLAYFSSHGPSFDGRVKPNTVATGLYAAIVTTNGDVVKMGQGTSFACPITSGAVACLWQANKTKTNIELLHAIEASASMYSTPDTLKGYGIPDFCKAYSILTGIDAYLPTENVLTVYPNPFQSGFSIAYTSSTDELITLELRDITGRLIKSQNQKVNASQQMRLNFATDKELANGVYVISLSTSKQRLYKKIIKE